MSNLYNALCEVRTSMLNIIGQQYLDGRPRNLPRLLKVVGEEISDHMNVPDEFTEEFMDMTEDQLLDLGFNYLNDESSVMLIPAWIFPLIPDGVLLQTVEGEVFEMEDDTTIELHGDSWVNASFYIEHLDI